MSRVLDACPGAVASTGIGTYEYWPAEQMTGSYDKRVDIYSLGLVLYELSNRNRLPFASYIYVTGKEVSLRLSGAALPAPSEAGPILAKVILKATAFRPEDRYQNAGEMMRALDWASRKECSPVDLSMLDIFVPDEPSVRFETIPAKPTYTPKSDGQIKSSQNWSLPLENRVAKPEKSNGGSYLEEQNRRKSKKPRWIPVFLITLVFCAAVGCFAGPRIWEKIQFASTSVLPEEKPREDKISTIGLPEEEQDSTRQTETFTSTSTDIPGTEPKEENIAVAKVKMNIYSSPSIGSRVVTNVDVGEEVEILRIEPIGSVSWAYAYFDALNVKGWVDTNMLDMGNVNLTSGNVITPGNTDSSTPATVTTVPTVNNNIGTVGTTAPTTANAKYGVVTASELNIRSSANQAGEHVGTYKYGDRITILETYDGHGRTDKGWVSLSYVYVDGEVGSNVAYGTVTGNQVNVRSGPGTNYDISKTLYKNDHVQILEQVKIGDTTWGYVGGGWVSMSFVRLSSSVSDTSVPTSVPATIPATESSSDSITGIQVSPRKKTFCKGDSLTQDNLTVKAVYQSGKIETIQTGFSVSPSTLNTAGTQTVTVSYGGFTKAVDVEVIEFSQCRLQFSNDSSFYKHGDVNWLLSVSVGYVGNWPLAYHYTITETMDIDGGPNGDLWEGAKSGIAMGMKGDSYEDSGVSTYVIPATYVLPDDPTFGGNHSITVKIGDVWKTVHFTLTYTGDYNTGTGWELSDIVWT